MNPTTLRLNILRAIQSENRGDIGLSLGMADLIMALYVGESGGRPLLKYDYAKPQWAERDYVLLSDPAAYPALFECLKGAGYEVGNFNWNKYAEKTPGVEKVFSCSGQGLAVGIGVAQSLLISKKPNRVYVFLDDHDLKAGFTWEAAMEAAFQRLDNLVVLVGSSGTAKLESVQDKFESFGWRVKKLVSGHNLNEISDAIFAMRDLKRKPMVILAPIILGKGVPFIEGKKEYRASVFSEAEMAEALKYLKI